MSEGAGGAATLRVLVVCTANQCRSPMAEVLLARRLADFGVPAEVSSAGVLPGGAPASGGSVRAMATRGLSLDRHVSRTVTTEIVDDADLVLGMARRHVREVAVMRPDALPRTFTLRELVRRGEALGPRAPGQDLSSWLTSLSADRITVELLGEDERDDIADPIGGPDAAYEVTAAELEALIERLGRLLA